jgi:uncharacterized protein YciI
LLYAIITSDRPDSLPRRSRTRPEHLRYVQQLLEDGRLVVAGPHPAIDSPDPGPAGFTGSLIVAEFASLEEARGWARNDPYAKADVYAEVTVKPFLQVYP